MKIYKLILLQLFLSISVSSLAQVPDSIYVDYIKTVRLYNAGNQLSLPIIKLNSNDQVELHFDDMDANVKYYYYTWELCDYNWKPVNLSPFDYIKGFTEARINNYRFSAIANTRYTHYQALLPERNSYPIKAGNYLLKVYLDGNKSKIAFTKRVLVVDNKAAIAAQATQPFAPEFFRTHQKIQFRVDVKGLNDFNAAQNLKVVILQNNRWDNAMKNLKPAFVRGTTVEYNSETSGIFPGGKEWRWLDLRDFKLQSDRVDSADYKKLSTTIYLKPDGSRADQRYIYYQDLNGMYTSEAIRGINPFWEADYATVNFSFVPPNNREYANQDIFLFGQLTNYSLSDSLKMTFNPDKGIYETHLLLKQGYYDYSYLLADKNNRNVHIELDGNYYETENSYTILVYYKSFSARTDELIGVATFNSRTDRPGFSF
ncbi:MAG: DUF5103 domain-containing protein [Ginsengibacter sp.]